MSMSKSSKMLQEDRRTLGLTSESVFAFVFLRVSCKRDSIKPCLVISPSYCSFKPFM
ncbi:unnamed protein product [Brassica napus]|uniref:(rape) hypothetical protein n=1 Tax=Brassica napus TaxID=3708 RepID=A0A816W4U4_BRANA|nr:unnamed protein product [Brassica napus]